MNFKKLIKKFKTNFSFRKRVLVVGGISLIGIVAIGFLVKSTDLSASVLSISKIVKKPVKQLGTCTDTDGGTDHNVKGTITVVADGITRTERDTCNPDGTLREWFCGNQTDPAGLLRSENYVNCTNGCTNGRCISSTVSVNTITQNFAPRLVQLNGSNIYLGQLSFKAIDGIVKLKQLGLSLLGYSLTSTPYTNVALEDDGTVIDSFSNIGNNELTMVQLYQTIATNATRTYDILVSLKNATTAADLGSTPFSFSLTTAKFEDIVGAILINSSPLNVAVSPVVTLVKAKPTVSYVSSQKAANAVYKFSVTANGGDITIDTLKLALGVHTDMANSIATLWLGNEGGTALGTAPVTSSTTPASPLSFANLGSGVYIPDGTTQDFTLVFPVSTWYQGANPGNISIEIANISYVDLFADASQVLHPNMFDLFKPDLAPVSTLVTLQ